MASLHRVLRLALSALTVSALIGPLAFAGSDQEITTPDYRGPVVDDPAAEALLVVQGRRSDRRFVGLQIKNAEIFCEDGTSYRALIGDSTRFRGDRFHAEHPDPGLNDGYEIYEEIGGRFLSRGRAKGFFVQRTNYDGSSSSNPDCSTLGRIRWTARRVSP